MNKKLVTISVLIALFYSRFSANSQTNNAYTGQQIFQGLFFGVGPVAQLFPELYSDGNVKAPPPNIALLVSNLREQAAVLNTNGNPEDGGKLLSLAKRLSSLPPNTVYGTNTAVVQAIVLNEVNASDPAFFNRFASNMQSGNAVMVSSALKEGSERLWNATQALPDNQFSGGIQPPNLLAIALVFVVVIVWFLARVMPDISSYKYDDLVSMITTRLNPAAHKLSSSHSPWGIIFLLLAVLACCIYIIVLLRRKEKR